MFLNVPVMMGAMSRQADRRRRVARAVMARRGVLGLTQEALAEKAGVDHKTIYNIESAERWPQAKTRAKIEDALEWIDGDMLRIADGDTPLGEDELIQAAGTDDFERKMREAIEALPPDERSVVEELYAEHLAMQEQSRKTLEKLILLFSGRRHRDSDDGPASAAR